MLVLFAAWPLLSCSSADGAAPATPSPPTEEPGAPLPEVACLSEMLAPGESGRVDVPISIRVGELRAVAEAPQLAPSGREHTLSFFGFYLTRPILVDAANHEVPATLLTAEGT